MSIGIQLLATSSLQYATASMAVRRSGAKRDPGKKCDPVRHCYPVKDCYPVKYHNPGGICGS